jgi:hypothetical protein
MKTSQATIAMPNGSLQQSGQHRRCISPRHARALACAKQTLDPGASLIDGAFFFHPRCSNLWNTLFECFLLPLCPLRLCGIRVNPFFSSTSRRQPPLSSLQNHSNVRSIFSDDSRRNFFLISNSQRLTSASPRSNEYYVIIVLDRVTVPCYHAL